MKRTGASIVAVASMWAALTLCAQDNLPTAESRIVQRIDFIGKIDRLGAYQKIDEADYEVLPIETENVVNVVFKLRPKSP